MECVRQVADELDFIPMDAFQQQVRGMARASKAWVPKWARVMALGSPLCP